MILENGNTKRMKIIFKEVHNTTAAFVKHVGYTALNVMEIHLVLMYLSFCLSFFLFVFIFYIYSSPY